MAAAFRGQCSMGARITARRGKPGDDRPSCKGWRRQFQATARSPAPVSLTRGRGLAGLRWLGGRGDLPCDRRRREATLPPMSLSDAEIQALLCDPAQQPPSARHLGFELLAFSVAEAWAEVAFSPRPEFANPAGHVQGGFVCAMLDDAMGFTASISQRFAVLVPTLQVCVSYLRPTPIAPRYCPRRGLAHGKRDGAFARPASGYPMAPRLPPPRQRQRCGPFRDRPSARRSTGAQERKRGAKERSEREERKRGAKDRGRRRRRASGGQPALMLDVSAELPVHIRMASNTRPGIRLQAISFFSIGSSGSACILRISSPIRGPSFCVDMCVLPGRQPAIGGLMPWKKIHEMARPTQMTKPNSETT